MSDNLKLKITYPYAGEPVKPCSACGTPIFFKLMKSGKYMPVNRDTLESHFADCGSASDFRKDRKGPKQGREVKFKQA